MVASYFYFNKNKIIYISEYYSFVLSFCPVWFKDWAVIVGVTFSNLEEYLFLPLFTSRDFKVISGLLKAYFELGIYWFCLPT